jgi:hypothetical protein
LICTLFKISYKSIKMIRGLINRVGSGIVKVVGAMREPVRRLGQVGYAIGKFAVDNHATLAPLLHGVAVASGNQTAQKISGGLLALSKTATMRQNLNADNKKIASATGYGVYDHSKGGYT